MASEDKKEGSSSYKRQDKMRQVNTMVSVLHVVLTYALYLDGR